MYCFDSVLFRMMSKKVGKEGSKSQKTIHMENLSTLKFYRNIIGGVTVSYIYSKISLFADTIC